MFTNVLVPVESASQTTRVLAVAELLGKLGSLHGSLHAPLHVTLVHATTHMLGNGQTQVSSDELEHLTERLRKYRVDARYLLEFEAPERGIVDAATQAHADLIVLMPHGRQGLDALLHPSVTAKLLASGTAPLLIWPERLPDKCSRDLLYFPDSKVVLPLDGSQLAERALPYAIDLANAYQRSLLLVRVTPDLLPPMATMGGGAYAPADLLRVGEDEKLGDESAEEYGAGCHAEYRVHALTQSAAGEMLRLRPFCFNSYGRRLRREHMGRDLEFTSRKKRKCCKVIHLRCTVFVCQRLAEYRNTPSSTLRPRRQKPLCRSTLHPSRDALAG
jgi:nucleotide-binding universal stress UspA family protein